MCGSQETADEVSLPSKKERLKGDREMWYWKLRGCQMSVSYLLIIH